MVKELIKKFEPWDMNKNSFKIGTFRIINSSENIVIGVSVTLIEYDLIVKSYSEDTTESNLKRCFDIIETILMNYML